MLHKPYNVVYLNTMGGVVASWLVHSGASGPGARFWKLPVITGPIKVVLRPKKQFCFFGFQNYVTKY